jgi:hypothetical protein
VSDPAKQVTRKTNVFLTTVGTATPPGGKMGEWSPLPVIRYTDHIHFVSFPITILYVYELHVHKIYFIILISRRNIYLILFRE